MATSKATKAEPETTDVDQPQELAAENMIKNYVIASVGASIVPVPLFDIAAVVAIQIRMIQKLSQMYGTTFSERMARNVVVALGGGVLGFGAGAVVAASASKLIPGIGWMIGMASLPLVSGASTYAVGKAVVKHFEDGGTLFDFNAEDMRAYYREQLEKGRELAAKAKATLKQEKSKEAA